MKKVLSIFFLALYLTTVFSAFLPYVEYVLNYDYISKVLCINKDKPELKCHGKCHLNKNIKQTIKKQIPTKGSEEIPVYISNDFYPAIISKYEIIVFSQSNELLNKNKFHSILYSNNIYHDIFHPPQFI